MATVRIGWVLGRLEGRQRAQGMRALLKKKDGGGTEDEEHEVECRSARLGVCKLIGFDAGESACITKG